jgi:hypothetical protein
LFAERQYARAIAGGVHGQAVFLAYDASEHNSLTMARVSDGRTRKCVTSFGRSQRFGAPCRRVGTNCSNAWLCTTSWAFSRARTDVFAHLTA